MLVYGVRTTMANMKQNKAEEAVREILPKLDNFRIDNISEVINQVK